MSPEEKAELKKAVRQMQLGYAILEKDRRRLIRETNTPEALQSLSSAFQMALETSPMRTTSGLVQYYEALKKVKHDRPI